MECNFELKKDCLRVMVPRELDHHSAGQISAETDLLISTYQLRKIIFDFKNTEFMDSSGIGVIVGRCRNLHFSGGTVEAVHLNGQIQKIFLISGLHKIVHVLEEV